MSVAFFIVQSFMCIGTMPVEPDIASTESARSVDLILWVVL